MNKDESPDNTETERSPPSQESSPGSASIKRLHQKLRIVTTVASDERSRVKNSPLVESGTKLSSWKHNVKKHGTTSRFANPFVVSRTSEAAEAAAAGAEQNGTVSPEKDFKNVFVWSSNSPRHQMGTSSFFEEHRHVSPMTHVTSINPAHRAGPENADESMLRDISDKSKDHAVALAIDDPGSHLDLVHLRGVDLGQDVPVISAGFNILLVRDQVTVRLVVAHIFDAMVDPSVQVSKNILKEYIHEVSVHYRPNPFHNFHHAANVLHFLAVMLVEIDGSKMFSELGLFSLLLSALIHDVDHPGKTNLFEINSSSALALLYNDTSVLENHHCSMSFRLMQKPGTNVLSRMPLDQRKEVRKIMIASVLATDMSKHSELIEEAKCKAPLGGGRLEPSDQLFFGKLFLHSADLSGPAKQFHVAREWASRVTEEFNAQVVVELDLGLPVLSFMAAADEKTFLKNEIGFSGFFVAPLWRIVSKLCPELEFVHTQLESNINRYKILKEQQEKEEYTSSLASS